MKFNKCLWHLSNLWHCHNKYVSELTKFVVGNDGCQCYHGHQIHFNHIWIAMFTDIAKSQYHSHYQAKQIQCPSARWIQAQYLQLQSFLSDKQPASNIKNYILRQRSHKCAIVDTMFCIMDMMAEHILMAFVTQNVTLKSVLQLQDRLSCTMKLLLSPDRNH